MTIDIAVCGNNHIGMIHRSGCLPNSLVLLAFKVIDFILMQSRYVRTYFILPSMKIVITGFPSGGIKNIFFEQL